MGVCWESCVSLREGAVMKLLILANESVAARCAIGYGILNIEKTGQVTYPVQSK
ncbi:hypothetical protein GCM10025776_28430 [Corallincola platygyrae]